MRPIFVIETKLRIQESVGQNPEFRMKERTEREKEKKEKAFFLHFSSTDY